MLVTLGIAYISHTSKEVVIIKGTEVWFARLSTKLILHSLPSLQEAIIKVFKSLEKMQSSSKFDDNLLIISLTASPFPSKDRLQA